MPVIHVSMLGAKSAEEKRNLVRGITNAVVKALGVEPGKVTIFLKEYGGSARHREKWQLVRRNWRVKWPRMLPVKE